MAASLLRIPEPATSPAAYWTTAGRLAAATLVLGAGFELAANSIGPQESPSTTLAQNRWAADHPGSANLIFVFALLAQDGRFDLTALAEVVDEVSSSAVIVMFLMFIPFAFFGLLTSAAALWRSGAVPRGAVLLIPAFIVVDFFLNEGFGIAPEFAGPAISFVAACWIALAVLMAGRQVSPGDVPER
jgi:hypothetical protein